RNPSLADIRTADWWNTDGPAQRLVRNARRHVTGVSSDWLISVDAVEDRNNRQRIPATQRLSAPGVGVISETVAASDDRGVVKLVGEAYAWRKELLAVADSGVPRDATAATDKDLIGGRII